MRMRRCQREPCHPPVRGREGGLSRSKRFGQPKCGPRHSPRYGRRMSVPGRFCCKSLFALVIKISFGCARHFRVNMWGTSLPEDKLAGDLGNVQRLDGASLGVKTARASSADTCFNTSADDYFALEP